MRYELAVPYTNDRVWERRLSAPRGYGATPEFSEWLHEMGWRHDHFWYDNTSKSTDEYGVLIFDSMANLMIFQMAWGTL